MAPAASFVPGEQRASRESSLRRTDRLLRLCPRPFPDRSLLAGWPALSGAAPRPGGSVPATPAAFSRSRLPGRPAGRAPLASGRGSRCAGTESWTRKDSLTRVQASGDCWKQVRPPPAGASVSAEGGSGMAPAVSRVCTEASPGTPPPFNCSQKGRSSSVDGFAHASAPGVGLPSPQEQGSTLRALGPPSPPAFQTPGVKPRLLKDLTKPNPSLFPR